MQYRSIQNSLSVFRNAWEFWKSASWENYGKLQRAIALRNASPSPGTRSLMGTTMATPCQRCVYPCLRTRVRVACCAHTAMWYFISQAKRTESTVDSLYRSFTPYTFLYTICDSGDFALQRFSPGIRQTCIRMYRFISTIPPLPYLPPPPSPSPSSPFFSRDKVA